jgi:mono/diheme cytochrome c family protein
VGDSWNKAPGYGVFFFERSQERESVTLGWKQIAVGIIATIAFMAIGVVIFIGSGIYNIGADDHHTALSLAVIQELRERSIGARSDAIDVPRLEDPSKISAGAALYSTLCVGCHLAPGVTKSDLRKGLYPHPPNLGQEDTRDARRAFWTIKHGIKMSAMPAWGTTLNDESVWNIVAFVRQMPGMTPETYQQLSMSRAN